jgi:hypothetical protein
VRENVEKEREQQDIQLLREKLDQMSKSPLALEAGGITEAIREDSIGSSEDTLAKALRTETSPSQAMPGTPRSSGGSSPHQHPSESQLEIMSIQAEAREIMDRKAAHFKPSLTRAPSAGLPLRVEEPKPANLKNHVARAGSYIEADKPIEVPSLFRDPDGTPT